MSTAQGIARCSLFFSFLIYVYVCSYIEQGRQATVKATVAAKSVCLYWFWVHVLYVMYT